MHEPPTLGDDGVAAHDPPEWSVACSEVTVLGQNVPIVSNVSCRISATGVTAIIGPNGAGKSMLLRVIAGLVRPDSGTVEVHPAFAGKTAMVFQRPVLLRRNVRANLNHALRIAGMRGTGRKDRLEELLSDGGLAGLAKRPARALSGGEQQLLQMSRALALSPRLLMMDEPSASLDPQSTMAIETLIRSTLDSGVKILLVTHDIGQARRLAEDAMFIYQGRLIEHEPADFLLNNSSSEKVRAHLEGRLEL